MRYSQRTSKLSLFGVLAILAACYGGVPPQEAGGILGNTVAKPAPIHKDYAQIGPLLYVADRAANTVTVYNAKLNNPSPIATIAENDFDGPSGECLDSKGTLYVVNNNSSTINEYPSGQTTPSVSIAEGLSDPAMCALDGNGNLWVTNIGEANVTEYKKNTTTPATVLTNGITEPRGIGFDKSRNLYVANWHPSPSAPNNVQIFSPGATSPSRTITDGITSAVGIVLDANGTLYVANIRDDNVEEYLAGQSHPYQKITRGFSQPIGLTVDKHGRLYVSDLAKNVIVEFRPRSTVPMRARIKQDVSSPEGVAYSPPLLP